MLFREFYYKLPQQGSFPTLYTLLHNLPNFNGEFNQIIVGICGGGSGGGGGCGGGGGSDMGYSDGFGFGEGHGLDENDGFGQIVGVLLAAAAVVVEEEEVVMVDLVLALDMARSRLWCK
ncbi:hypothetical protein KY284_010856 [Solanum tuberosum]|nr:hypothetical protein KY284_010856 [Solanum tuberosum]